MTLYLHIHNFIFLVPIVTSQTTLLDFFPENALGDDPKNSRIRVKFLANDKGVFQIDAS